MGALNEFLQAAEVIHVRSAAAPRIETHAVLHDLVLIQNGVEHSKWATTADHVVFRDDFKPINRRFLAQDMIVMRHPQSNAGAQRLTAGESGMCHGSIR